MSVGSNGSENYAEDLWDDPVASIPASGATGNPSDFPINSSIEFQRTDGSQWTPGIVRGYWFNGVIVDDSLTGTSYMARWSEIRPVMRRVFKPKVRAVSPNTHNKSASGGSRRRHGSRNRRRQKRTSQTRRRRTHRFK